MTALGRASYRLGATLLLPSLTPATPNPFKTAAATTTTTTTRAANAVVGLAGHAHLTAGHLSTAKSREEAMDVVVAKIISLLVLTVLSVLCGLLPLRLLIHNPHIFSRNRKPVESFLCGLRLFSGGIYLATCFLHLLPDTRDKMAAVMDNMGSRTTYAVPELLVITGFYAVVFMEQIIKTLYVSAENSDTRRKKRRRSRRVPEVYTSTLDERDTNHSRDRLELTDEHCHRKSSRYDDESDNNNNDDNNDDEDDDDDENNVLVDDEDDEDDDFIVDSDTDSDQCSQNSYTCVKKRLGDYDYDEKQFREASVPRNHNAYHQNQSPKFGSCPSTDKKASNCDNKESSIISSVVTVHAPVSSASSSPAIITSTTSLSPATNATIQPLSSVSSSSSSSSSSPLQYSSSSPSASTTTTTATPNSCKVMTTALPVYPDVSNTHHSCSSISSKPTLSSSAASASSKTAAATTSPVFKSVHEDNDHDHQYNQTSTLLKRPNHNNTNTPAATMCQNQVIPHNHVRVIDPRQPYNTDALTEELTDKICSRVQRPNNSNNICPTPKQNAIISRVEAQQVPHVTGQYPKFTEPSIQYIADDKIRIQGNHVESEGIRLSSAVDGDNVKFTFDPLREKDSDSGIFSSKRESDEKFTEERRCLMLNSSENSIADRISDCACSSQEFQVRQVVDELKHPELSSSAHFRSIIYIMALAFHGIFEGMALGLQSMKNSVWALCFAIVVHRCVLAFKLGMDLCRGEEKQGTSFLCIGTFTLISALGIIIGILISSGASFYSDVSVPEAILQSLATGTIIYIVFLDILIKDLQGRNDLKRVSCTFVGFSLMAVVFAVASS